MNNKDEDILEKMFDMLIVDLLIEMRFENPGDYIENKEEILQQLNGVNMFEFK